MLEQLGQEQWWVLEQLGQEQLVLEPLGQEQLVLEQLECGWLEQGQLGPERQVLVPGLESVLPALAFGALPLQELADLPTSQVP